MKKFSRIVTIIGCLLSFALISAKSQKPQTVPLVQEYFTLEYKKDNSILIWHKEQLMVDNTPIILNKKLVSQEDLHRAGYKLREETNKEFFKRLAQKNSVFCLGTEALGFIGIYHATKEQPFKEIRLVANLGLIAVTVFTVVATLDNYEKGKKVIIVPIDEKK
jgi:hypothetical protein